MQQSFKRLVAWVHDFKADDAAQADRMARITADAVNEALKPLKLASAWAPTVTDLDQEDGGLDDIIDRAYLLDEADGDTAYVPLNETLVFDMLLAWRDAAVKAALDAMLPAGLDRRVAEITAFLETVDFDHPDYYKLCDERAGSVRLKRDHEAAVKRATGGA